MHYTHLALLAASLAPFVVRAADELEIEEDDIPRACRSICQPIRTLTQRCDIDNDRVSNDRVENLLNLQCVCTNASFDVARFAGLCQSCVAANVTPGDRDDVRDINRVMGACSFPATSYDAARDGTAADSVTVSVSRPSRDSDLTTTIVSGAVPTATSTGLSNSAATTGTTTGSGSGSQSQPTTGTTSGSAAQTSAPGSAAPAMLPLTGASLVVVAGAVAMFM